MKRHLLYAAAVFFPLMLGCGGETDAERGVVAADLTSCQADRLVQPASCQTPPDVICAGTVEACATDGCVVAGSGLTLYPDRSWRDVEVGVGEWSTRFADGFEYLLAGGRELRVDVTPQLAIPGCN